MFKADPKKPHSPPAKGTLAKESSPRKSVEALESPHKKKPTPPQVCFEAAKELAAKPKADAKAKGALARLKLPVRVLCQHGWWSANEHEPPMHRAYGRRKQPDQVLAERVQALANLAEPEFFCYNKPCNAANATERRLSGVYVLASSSPAGPKLFARKSGGLGAEENVDDAARWRLVLGRGKEVRIQNVRFDERFLAVGDRCVDQETEEPDAGTLRPDPEDAVWRISQAGPGNQGLYFLRQPKRGLYLVPTPADNGDGLGTSTDRSAPGALWAVSPAPPAAVLD